MSKKIIVDLEPQDDIVGALRRMEERRIIPRPLPSPGLREEPCKYGERGKRRGCKEYNILNCDYEGFNPRTECGKHYAFLEKEKQLLNSTHIGRK